MSKNSIKVSILFPTKRRFIAEGTEFMVDNGEALTRSDLYYSIDDLPENKNNKKTEGFHLLVMESDVIKHGEYSKLLKKKRKSDITHIAVLCWDTTPYNVLFWCNSQVDFVLTRGSSGYDFFGTVHNYIKSGKRYFTPEVYEILPGYPNLDRKKNGTNNGIPTKREIKIVNLICTDHSSKEIMKKMNLNRGQFYYSFSSVKKKFGCQTTPCLTGTFYKYKELVSRKTIDFAKGTHRRLKPQGQ